MKRPDRDMILYCPKMAKAYQNNMNIAVNTYFILFVCKKGLPGLTFSL